MLCLWLGTLPILTRVAVSSQALTSTTPMPGVRALALPSWHLPRLDVCSLLLTLGEAGGIDTRIPLEASLVCGCALSTRPPFPWLFVLVVVVGVCIYGLRCFRLWVKMLSQQEIRHVLQVAPSALASARSLGSVVSLHGANPSMPTRLEAQPESSPSHVRPWVSAVAA